MHPLLLHHLSCRGSAREIPDQLVATQDVQPLAEAAALPVEEQAAVAVKPLEGGHAAAKALAANAR